MFKFITYKNNQGIKTDRKIKASLSYLKGTIRGMLLVLSGSTNTYLSKS
jgi:hypothetical protein